MVNLHTHYVTKTLRHMKILGNLLAFSQKPKIFHKWRPAVINCQTQLDIDHTVFVAVNMHAFQYHAFEFIPFSFQDYCVFKLKRMSSCSMVEGDSIIVCLVWLNV